MSLYKDLNRLFTMLAFAAFFQLTGMPLLAQNPQWQWAKSGGGKGPENAYASALDKNGNVIIAGYFYSDTMVVGIDTLINNGNYDCFVVKYDKNGNILWAKSSGGAYDDVAISLTTCQNNDIYVTGYFYSPSIISGTDTLLNKGSGDCFVMKYDAAGNLIWMQGIGGTGDESGMGITCKTNGNPVVCGWFQGDSIQLGNSFKMGYGSDDCFISEITPQGNVMWGKTYGDVGSDIASCITLDASDNIYFGGHYSSSTFTLGNTVLTNSGNSDFFVAKANATGDVVWAKKGGGAFSDQATSVSVDRFNTVSVCGTFLSATLSIENISTINTGNFDMYLAKFSANGSPQWLWSTGGIFDENAYGVVNDWAGNVIVTGHFHSPSTIVGADTLYNNGIGDLYLTALDSAGNWKWTQQLGGAADDGSSGLCTDGVGNIYVNGFSISPSISQPEFTITTNGVADFFVAKLSMNLVFTGITEIEEDLSFSVFPNPTRDKLNFYSKDQVNVIEVNDLMGRQVARFELNTCNGNVDLSFLPLGLYVLKFQTGINFFTSKIILE